jgi:phage/plasmid-like protein (TIGR03299 family)
MAANILEKDNMVYSGTVPWHGLGVEAPTDSLYDWTKFAESANLLWGVRKMPLVTIDYANKIMKENIEQHQDNRIESNTDAYAIIRDDTDDVLGVVGPHYTPLPNKDAFSFFQDWLDTQEVQLHTAGTLFNGKKTWILAKLNNNNNIQDVVPNDPIERYILLSNSHDGSSAVRLGFSNIRVVCYNTLTLAHNASDSKLIRTIHSRQMKKNLEDIKNIMQLSTQEFLADMAQYKYLASRDINKEDLEKYVKILLEIENKEDDKVSTRTKNIMKSIMNLMDAQEQAVKGISGTWWAAYQAYNNYLVHRSSRNNESRLNNIWFGLNKMKDKKAFDLAIQMAG